MPLPNLGLNLMRQIKSSPHPAHRVHRPPDAPLHTRASWTRPTTPTRSTRPPRMRSSRPPPPPPKRTPPTSRTARRSTTRAPQSRLHPRRSVRTRPRPRRGARTAASPSTRRAPVRAAALNIPRAGARSTRRRRRRRRSTTRRRSRSRPRPFSACSRTAGSRTSWCVPPSVPGKPRRCQKRDRADARLRAHAPGDGSLEARRAAHVRRALRQARRRLGAPRARGGRV
jgi:hypothetical protein